MVDGRNVCMYSSRRDPNTVTEDDVRDALVKQDIKTVRLDCVHPMSYQQFATEQLRVFDPKEAARLKEGLVTEQKAFVKVF